MPAGRLLFRAGNVSVCEMIMGEEMRYKDGLVGSGEKKLTLLQEPIVSPVNTTIPAIILSFIFL